MKTLHTVAALIADNYEEINVIYAIKKDSDDDKELWEFPGGNVEAGESPKDAVIRVIKEKLSVEIKVCDEITTIEYDCKNIHVIMDCFWCEIADGEINLSETIKGKWLYSDKLNMLEWMPPYKEILEWVNEKLYVCNLASKIHQNDYDSVCEGLEKGDAFLRICALYGTEGVVCTKEIVDAAQACLLDDRIAGGRKVCEVAKELVPNIKKRYTLSELKQGKDTECLWCNNGLIIAPKKGNRILGFRCDNCGMSYNITL